MSVGPSAKWQATRSSTASCISADTPTAYRWLELYFVNFANNVGSRIDDNAAAAQIATPLEAGRQAHQAAINSDYRTPFVIRHFTCVLTSSPRSHPADSQSDNESPIDDDPIRDEPIRTDQSEKRAKKKLDKQNTSVIERK